MLIDLADSATWPLLANGPMAGRRFYPAEDPVPYAFARMVVGVPYGAYQVIEYSYTGDCRRLLFNQGSER